MESPSHVFCVNSPSRAWRFGSGVVSFVRMPSRAWRQGRRYGLKHRWGNPCGFESRRPPQWLRPGPRTDPTRQLVSFLAVLTRIHTRTGVFLSKLVHKRKIEVPLELHDFSSQLDIVKRLVRIDEGDRQPRVATEVAILHRVRLHAQQDMLAIPQKPDGVDLWSPTFINRRQVSQRRALENVMETFRNRAAWHRHSPAIAPPQSRRASSS